MNPEDKARELVDWRTHYRNHFGVFLGVAFGAGTLLALLAVPRVQRSSALVLAGSEPGPDPYRPSDATWAGRSAGSATRTRALRQLAETWEQITDGLLRTSSATAIQFVSELIPGLRDHLEPRVSRPTGVVSH